MHPLERLIDWGIQKGIQVFTPLGYFVADEKEKWMALFGWYVANTFFFGLFLYQHPDFLSYVYALIGGTETYLAYTHFPAALHRVDLNGLVTQHAWVVIPFVLSPITLLLYHPTIQKWAASLAWLRTLPPAPRSFTRKLLARVGILYFAVLFSYQITSVDYQSIAYFHAGIAYLIPVVLFFIIYWVKRERFEPQRKITIFLTAKLWLARIFLIGFFISLLIFYAAVFFASGIIEQTAHYFFA